MADQNIQELLGTVECPVELLRNAQVGPNVYPGVPAEFTNWRDEQQAWQQTCVLYNQSFHMAELMVEGPDALALLTSLGVNSFATFEPGKAKQFVPCTPDGYVIGDVILFGLAENRYNLVGRAPVLNWVTYHAETAGHDVEVAFDQRTALRNDGRRRHYRFQRSSRRPSATRPRTSSSSTCAPSRSPASRSRPCATAWPASRGGSSSGRGRSTRRSTRRS